MLVVLVGEKPASDKQFGILLCYLHQAERSVALHTQGKEVAEQKYTLQII